MGGDHPPYQRLKAAQEKRPEEHPSGLFYFRHERVA